MASGDPVLEVLEILPPAASAATPDVRAGGSTPAESIPVRDFDADAVEYVDFLCRLSEKYAGGGLTFTLPYMMTSATANLVMWGIAIRRIADDAEDVDGAHTYDFNETADTVPNVSGEVGYPTITFTEGADMDSWAAGELAVVRVRRNATDATNDTATGDAELIGLSAKET